MILTPHIDGTAAYDEEITAIIREALRGSVSTYDVYDDSYRAGNSLCVTREYDVRLRVDEVVVQWEGEGEPPAFVVGESADDFNGCFEWAASLIRRNGNLITYGVS